MSRIKKFSKWVMRNSKYLLIGYVLVAILLLPYSMMATQKMTVSQEVFLPGDVESKIAGDVLKKDFGWDESSGILVVVHSTNGSDLLNQKMYHLLSKLKNYVLNDWTVDDVSYAESYMDFFIVTGNLFNATSEFYFGQVVIANLTRNIVWGLPSVFAYYWMLNFTTTNNEVVADSYAGELMNATATNFITFLKIKYDSEKTREFIDFIKGYVNLFIYTWGQYRSSSSLRNLLPPINSMDKAVTTVVRSVVSLILPNISDSTYAMLVNLTSSHLNFTTWESPQYFYDVVLNHFSYSFNVDTSDSQERGYIYDVLMGEVFSNKSIYWEYYLNVVRGDWYPQLFPSNILSDLRNDLVSRDHDTMLILITVKKEVKDWDDVKIKSYIDKLRGYLVKIKQGDLEFYVTGELAFRVDNTSNSEEDVKRIDIITFIFALVLLLLIYRGVPVSFLPLVLMGLTVIIARAAILFLSLAIGLNISDITLALMTTVIIGAGVDYTVFLISRYAEDRKRGLSKEDSIISVIKHAGKSVLLSGGTVMIAFGSLTLSSFKFLQHVGLGIMTGVGLTLFVSLTLTPSILTVFGDKIFWPSNINSRNRVSTDSIENVHGKIGVILKRIAQWTTKNASVVVILALIATLPALYIYNSHGTTYDFMELTREGTPSKVGFKILSDEIGYGSYSSTEVVAVFHDVNFTNEDGSVNITLVELYIKPVSDKLERVNGVVSVKSAYKPYGTPLNDSVNNGNIIEKMITLSVARSQYISENGTIARLSVSINATPYSEKAFKIIDNIRRALSELKNEMKWNVDFFVGGLSASYRDISHLVNEDFKLLTVLVIAGIIALLFVAIRSLLIPIRLEITILLSIVWAIALSMLFWEIYASLKLIWFIPIFMFTVLNGLGMDYDIFLITRIEEEKFEKGLSDTDAIVEAVASTGKIISIAGLIMAAAFGSLLLTLSPPMREIGLTLMLGVLLDAYIVRILLVPAIMVLAGKWNWWPRRSA